VSKSRDRGRDRDRQRTRVLLKIQEKERLASGAEELELPEAHEATFPAGAPAAGPPRAEDEQVRDEPDDGGDEDATPAPTADDEPYEPPARAWARDALLRGRAPVVAVRLRDAGEHAVPHPTLTPRGEPARAMLDNLCDFLRDRFGPPGRALFPDAAEWAKLLGRTPARPAERLALLARLTVTGQHEFARTSGGSVKASDVGLGHYRYKFAALPDGVPFSIGLLLAGGKTGAKGSGAGAGCPTFETLPVGLRLLALAAALRRERDEEHVRGDDLFRVLLRDEAARLLGNPSLPAVPVTVVRRFREWLERNGRGDLFPGAPDRRKALAGDTS
jgi:hypothetical protein